jgi:hypothetical protein
VLLKNKGKNEKKKKKFVKKNKNERIKEKLVKVNLMAIKSFLNLQMKIMFPIKKIRKFQQP